ncbi:MAG: YbaK/EbsC family protein [Rhodospirillales bacterium]|jgi:prolyl-tRNA editing enzyme YbaK/EbsC (Cys-tRNA(Pro) deacylase)|nr:YbaK/EbsC family protein [Rhodospirillales bacterium]
MTQPLRPAAQRIQQLLAERDYDCQVVEFAETTRSSADAAAAIGCEVAQIAKSLVFRAKPSGRAVLVIASGANRVDEKAVAAALGEGLGKADAEFVRDRTGFAIGGVAPIGHATPPVTFIDEDLFRHETIWAAAGTPFSVFRLTPAQLVEMTAGRVLKLAAGNPA